MSDDVELMEGNPRFGETCVDALDESRQHASMLTHSSGLSESSLSNTYLNTVRWASMSGAGLPANSSVTSGRLIPDAIQHAPRREQDPLARRLTKPQAFLRMQTVSVS